MDKFIAIFMLAFMGFIFLLISWESLKMSGLIDKAKKRWRLKKRKPGIVYMEDFKRKDGRRK